MIAPEDFSLQRRFRYLEWAAIIMTVLAQIAWTRAVVLFDVYIGVSFFLLAVSFVISGFAPRTLRWRFVQLICQTALICFASALGAHHSYYLNLYVLAAKAALLLPRRQMLMMGGILILSHIAAGQFAIYALHNIHTKVRPEPRYYRTLVLEGQAALYFIVGLITVTFLGRTLIAERKSRSAERALQGQVENLSVQLERARIARNIHDGLGNTLTSLRIQLELVPKLLEEGKADKALELLTRCQDSARSSLQEVRRAVKTEKDGDLNLTQAVNDLVEQIDQQGTFAIEVKLDDINLPLTCQHQIFRIVQECLTNARKHSNATHVQIKLTLKDGQASLCVKDDGKGFEVGQTNSGFGLKGLHERAEAIGGKVKIESHVGQGTEILVSFPALASATNSSSS